MEGDNLHIRIYRLLLIIAAVSPPSEEELFEVLLLIYNSEDQIAW